VSLHHGIVALHRGIVSLHRGKVSVTRGKISMTRGRVSVTCDIVRLLCGIVNGQKGVENMNVLYKYCNTDGFKGILETLELKLPSISEVNDPLECFPFPYCPDDKSAMKENCLRTFNRNHITPANWEQKLNEQFENGEIQKKLIDGLRGHLCDLRQKTFLLSVSQEARSTVMWAHYADKHKGGVIGIDFDQIFPEYSLKVDRVNYSKQRPRMNVLDDFESSEFFEKYRNTLFTKSDEWVYEKEYRNIFDDVCLINLKKQGLACQKDFNGKDTWFLRLNPASIKEVAFGLYTKKSLKEDIKELIKRPDLKHINLLQAEESETYTFNLKDIA